MMSAENRLAQEHREHFVLGCFPNSLWKQLGYLLQEFNPEIMVPGIPRYQFLLHASLHRNCSRASLGLFSVWHAEIPSGVTPQPQPHPGAALAAPNSSSPSSPTDLLPPTTSRGDCSFAAVNCFCQKTSSPPWSKSSKLLSA